MTAYLLANHLLNFLAPAAFMALLVPGLCRLLPVLRPRPGGKSALPGWRRQLVITFGVNLLVSAAGLLIFQHDGKLLTYAAMVLASAASQWVLLRGWKA
jgi:hypothetical protein